MAMGEVGHPLMYKRTLLRNLRPVALLVSAASVSPLFAGSASCQQTHILIEPGKRVGALSLGAAKSRAFEIFPFKDKQDQEWKDECGVTFNWVDQHPNGSIGGNVFVRFKSGKVFQIEAATTRFQTKEGITMYNSPEKVRRFYSNLRAFALMDAPLKALGDRPLIFWVDKRMGIAFVFAFDQDRRKRYLYKISIFSPGTNPCVEDHTTYSPTWREIAPYSLEPPDTIAMIH